jgi:O-antigen biosynthesis protein
MKPFNKLAAKVRLFNRRRLQKRHWRRQREGRDVSADTGGGSPYFCIEPSAVRLPTTTINGGMPRVSIVIAAYGKIDYTLRCLTSLISAQTKTPYEVIVVEDASGDPLADRIGQVQGIVFVSNEKNLGYLRSCNETCKLAQGEFIVLLNNDTEVLPGAIDAMVALADTHPEAGIVGAKLVYPDGRLQEAGCITWRDGTAWNFGRLQDPMLPQFNYVREVDYASAACVLIRNQLWQALHGFDEHYLPAYCEDLDLAFRVRAAGSKVLYQPQAVVVHHEGISHGTDTEAEGVKRYQTINQAKFRQRWAAVLDADHYDGSRCVFRAKDRARHRKFMLVVDHYVPEPDRDAGSRSMLDILAALVGSGHIVKFWPANQAYVSRYSRTLEQMGIEVICDPMGSYFPAWIDEHGADIDTVFISRPDIAEVFVPEIRNSSNARVLFYGHDLHHARMKMQQDLLGDASMLPAIEKMLITEKQVWLSADVVFYPSSEEARRVGELLPGVDARRLTPYAVTQVPLPLQPPATNTILFVAGFRHQPNEDAAVWLVEQVMPHVLSTMPEVQLVLAGSSPTEKVRTLAGPGVRVTGSLSSEALDTLYKTARVAVVPLRFGAGVKFKCVEAMAKGIPLVTTSVGVQGLDELPPSVRVHEDAVAFAKSIETLLVDDEAWMSLASEQQIYVVGQFNLVRLMGDLMAALTVAQSTVPLSKTGAVKRHAQATKPSGGPVGI